MSHSGHLFAVESSMVFVDLETTGGTATADRITEIGLIDVQGSNVTEWSSLVNPQTRIPPFIEQLTGISNAMVANAPRFDELASELLPRLQGRLFIAHNARFDYGFLKNEFKRMGLDFQAEVLCTVRLSRKLYPQHKRHNLDSLIERHQLPIDHRHRALGDARAIWHFWRTVEAEHPPALLARTVSALCARPSVPPHLDASVLEQVPEGHGIYLFYGENDLPLYIGKSKTLRQRVRAHFGADHRSAKEMSLSQQVRRIEWVQTQGEMGSLLLESAMVKQKLPTHNQRLRRASELCCWHLATAGTQGYARPELRWASDLDLGHVDDVFGLFTSQRDAKKQLTQLAEDNQLCLGRLGLESLAEGRSCFAHQLRQCAGACTGEESSATYNARLQQALQHLQIATWPYPGVVGVREGADFHVIDSWRHLGTARTEEEVWQLLDVGQPAFDKDVYRILRTYLPMASVFSIAGKTKPQCEDCPPTD